MIFSAVQFRLKKKKIVDCDCEFSCVYLRFHSDFICCVLRDLHADSLVGSFTQHLRRFVSFSSGCLQTGSWTSSIYCFSYVESTFSCVSLTLTVTPGLRLNSELKELLYISLIKSLNNQKKKTVDRLKHHRQYSQALIY